MSDYDQIASILRRLSVAGNSVATTYLHLLYNCDPGERDQILRQIRTFADSFTWQARQVGPSEFKGTETITPILKWD